MNGAVRGPAHPKFSFLIQAGSNMPNLSVKTFRMIKMEDDSIKVAMNGEIKEFNNMELFHDVFNLVMENKDKLVELSLHQAKQIEEHTLHTYKDSSTDELRITYANMGGNGIFITNKVNDKIVNDFYIEFKNKVFEVLKSYI